MLLTILREYLDLIFSESDLALFVSNIVQYLSFSLVFMLMNFIIHITNHFVFV